MAIELLSDINATTYSTGNFANPLSFTFQGTKSGSAERALILNNTDSTVYTTVEISVENIDLADPYTIYLSVDGISWGTAIGTTGLPKLLLPNTLAGDGQQTFWIKVETDQDSSIENYAHLKLIVDAS